MERLAPILHAGFRLIKSSCQRNSLCLTYPQLKYIQQRNAGHSHWANIRHIKGAKDKVKSDISSQLANQIRIALRDSTSANVKTNYKLAKAIEFGEKNNIPSKSIKSMIDKAISVKDSLSQTIYEAKGPSGSFLIFDISTANSKRTKNEMNRVLARRIGGSLMSAGGTNVYFEKKGVITAISKEGKNISLEDVEDIAISVEAEEVKLEEGSDDSGNSYQIICDENSLYTVVKALQETELDVLDFSVIPIPVMLVELTNDEKEAISSAIEGIKELQDVSVDNIYDNIKW